LRRFVPIVFVAVLLIAGYARAVDRTWANPVNGSWNTAGNWNPAGVPTAADDLTIPFAVTVSVNNGGNALANSLTITSGATINRPGAGNTRVMTVTNGITVTPSSNVTISVPFTAASLTKSGSGTLTLTAQALSGAGQEVTGAVNVTGGTLILNGANTFTTGGTVTVGTGAALTRAGAGTLAPQGGLTVNGGTVTFTAGGDLNSGGPVTLAGGSMTFNGSGGLSATGQTVTVGAGSSISTTAGASIAAGSVAINGGSVSFGGNGNLNASGAVSVGGGGSLSFAGNGNVFSQSFALASGSSFTINFATGADPTNVILSGGSGSLNGTVNITGTPNSNTSFNLVTGAGSVDINGVTLGSAPTGFAFGFRTSGTTTIVLDVTVNPIAPDATASATGSCGTPLTWQHTIGATANDRYLLVGVSTGASAVTPTSVTFGSQTMGLLTSQVTGTSGTFIYGLVAPTRGTGTITVTLPAGPCSVVGGSLSYTGVAQTASTGAPATAGGTGTTASVSPSTVQGDKVISVLTSNGATSATPQAGATVRWSGTSGTILGTGDTATRTGAGTFNVTMSWNLAPSSEFALAAIPIRAAAPTRAFDFAASVRASPRGAVVTVRSGAGSDLIGFRVWREVSGRRELLTPGLVAGPLLTRRTSLLGGSDAGWEDLHATPGAAYLVESLHRDGQTRWTRATPSGGPAPAFTSELVADSNAVASTPQMLQSVAAMVPPTEPAALNQGMQWQLAGADAVKLVVSRAGVVRVPAESLFAAGVPVGTPAASLQLFRNGRPVPRTVLTADGATLRSGDSIEFFGYGMNTRYSGSAVYWLVAGGGTGVEFPAASISAQPAGPATYMASVEVRERLSWFGAALNGDAEKFFGPAVYNQHRQRTLPVDALDVSASGARLEVALQGSLDVPHSVALSVNGLGVGSVDFSGVTPGTASIDLPPGLLVPGDNVVGMVSSGGADVSLEQYVRLVYPRLTMRGTGALDFALPAGSSARLDGFDPERTGVLDVTDPDAPYRVSVQDASGVAAVLATGSGTRHLIAYLPEDAAAPSSVARNHPSRWWASSGADLVVMGPAALFEAVRPLVERRQAEGLTVALVDFEDVQDEFASGEKSVDAVRLFLSRALTGWQRPPRYLLLLGKATYDPRDYLGVGGDLVPSAAVQTVETEAVSDSWFLGIPGASSVSVGRLPVSTVAETQAVVAKILGRREATARSPWLLVSDARGTSDFPEFTADLRKALPDAPATVLVRGSDTDDIIHQRFLDAARAGPALVNFMGHAAEEYWTEAIPAVYAAEDVPALSGSDASLWVHLTCWTGFFQDPRRQSLAVATLLAPSGGAWATWASTAGSYPGTHSAFSQALVKSLLVDGKTLGEATRDALAVASDPDVQSTFTLLGDPSARAVATQTQALQTRSSASSGCTAAPSAPGALAALLALAGWLAGIRQSSARRRSGD
jgi:Peptidase family C25